VKLVAQPEVREHVEAQGGAVYIWAKVAGCCHGRSFSLESATEPPPAREFELVHAADGFRVFATPGLRQPDELHLEVTRRGKLRAYWDGQAWIG
jgi:hypothetical protein